MPGGTPPGGGFDLKKKPDGVPRQAQTSTTKESFEVIGGGREALEPGPPLISDNQKNKKKEIRENSLLTEDEFPGG